MTALPADPDVIVIGAGAAGLSAAKALIADGFAVLVLEAAGHVGGRCVTDAETFAAPFDRGGSWLHAASVSPLARVAEAHGAKFWKDDPAWRFVHVDGRPLTAEEVGDYARYQMGMWAPVHECGRRDPQATIASALPDSPWRGAAGNWVAQLHGGDADVVAAADVAQYREGEGDWLVEGGLGAFVRALHADVPVRLNCPVTAVDHSARRVRVETPEGAITADRVVVTVSTGVLAAEAIRFHPPLPDEKLAAVEALPNGLLNKVGIEFDPAWREAVSGDLMDYHRGGEEYCTINFGFAGSSLAVGFTAGRFAAELEREAGAATAFCREALRASFGADVGKHIRKTCETAWKANALTFGSYSYARPGGAHQRAVLARPIDEKVYFAGEATSSEAYSTVHGAWMSGGRAARLISRAARS